MNDWIMVARVSICIAAVVFCSRVVASDSVDTVAGSVLPSATTASPRVIVSPQTIVATNAFGVSTTVTMTISNAADAGASLAVTLSASEDGTVARRQAVTDTAAAVAAPRAIAPAVNCVPGEILVRFKPDTRELRRMAVQSAVARAGGIRELGLVPGLTLMQLNGDLTVEQALKELNGSEGIAYAEPNYVYSTDVVPSDSRFGELWGLHNTGQAGGTPDADIDAPEAWERTTGSKAVVVAVIDTGVDYTHPDLDGNRWINAGEIAANGIDDDGNGYVDDVFGYDFVNGDPDPMDDNEHGTHCAGTIGAEGDNALGVVGVCWNVRIMALKFLDGEGNGSSSDAVLGIEYATRMGANVINASWGGTMYSQALKDAIAAAGAAGVTFVAAAGNDYGNDNDVVPHYPSNYDCDNIIAVMATDRDDQCAWFSNLGRTSVDLAAPGTDILSCMPGSGYQTLSGTSMATPHVSGACALLLALQPSLSPAEIREALLASVDATLAGQCVAGGRLNLAAALSETRGPWIAVTPAAITNIAPGCSAEVTVTLNAARLAPATYGGHIVITCNDVLTPSVTIPVTMTVMPDTLTVTPETTLEWSGSVGGPFEGSNAVYALTNTGTAPLAWSASVAADWLEFSSVSGLIPPGGTESATVFLGWDAALLPAGRYVGRLAFSNQTTGVSHSRTVVLTVNEIPLPTIPHGPKPGLGATDVPVAGTLSWNNPPDYRLLSGTGMGGANNFYLVQLQTDPVAERPIGYASYNPGLDMSPDGVLYGASASLRIIDPATGEATTIGAIHSADASSILMRSIAFHPDGRLFGVATESGALYAINPATAEATKIGPIDGFVWGIDFAPDGTLYGAEFELVTIDPDSGAILSTVGDLPDMVVDIDFSPDGFIHGVYYGSSSLYRILPADASIELVGRYDSETWGVASAPLAAEGRAEGMRYVALSAAEAEAQARDIERLRAQIQADMGAWHARQGQAARNSAGPRVVAGQRAEVSYRVYLDTVNPPRAELRRGVTETECNPGLLAADTLYYWRVVAENRGGAVTGLVWSFRTANEEAPLVVATHACDGYRPGATAALRCEVRAPGADGLLALFWRPILPEGWRVETVSGDGDPECRDGEIVFTGSLDTLPIVFTCTLATPEARREAVELGAEVEVALHGMVNPVIVRATPAPLRVYPLHTADYEGEAWVLQAAEASRVLSYWRAGGYHRGMSGLDGYAPGEGNTNGPRHSADYRAPYWKVDGSEVTRVLSYWRARRYHYNTRGLDGYAPGAASEAETAGLASEASVIQTGAGEYDPGALVLVTNSVVYGGELLGLCCALSIPEGWEVVSVTGDGAPILNEGEILWTGDLPPSPIRFTCTLRVPLEERRTVSVTSRVECQFPGMANPMLCGASPETLSVSPRDADGDGMPDAWERHYAGTPAEMDPRSDMDGDGMSNAEECIAGTDPTDAASALGLELEPAAGGGVQLAWPSVTGRSYSLLRANALTGGFTELLTDIPATPPRNVRWLATGEGRRAAFYRVGVAW